MIRQDVHVRLLVHAQKYVGKGRRWHMHNNNMQHERNELTPVFITQFFVASVDNLNAAFIETGTWRQSVEESRLTLLN